MPSYKARDKRQPVSIGARLRKEVGWSDAVIRNVSARGLMAACPAPPGRGEYVELRCGGQVIVAQVVWTRHGNFGARVRDRIEVGDLFAGIGAPATAAPADRRVKLRSAGLQAPPRDPAERAEASRRRARALDFVIVALAGAVAALLLASVVRDALDAPFARIGEALSSR